MLTPIDSIRIKIKWAEKHIDKLQLLIRETFDAKPHEIRSKIDPNTGNRVYYISRLSETPIEISLIIGDILHNLRGTLDHIASTIVAKSTGVIGSKKVAFPVFDGATKYHSEASGKVKGIGHEAMAVIDSIQPYKGGDGHALWVLHELNNTDKHRALIVHISVLGCINISPILIDEFAMLGRHDVVEFIESKPVFVPPMTRGQLKTGDVILVDAPDAKVYENLEFRFGIAFGEPQIVEPNEPLQVTIKRIADTISCVIDRLAPFI